MEPTIRGKTVVLGNNIDTDQIYPGRYLELVKASEIAQHCLEGVDPSIAGNFEKGGIVAAGTNFGCGSSREHAAIALINMGVSLVLADSFARIFFRNAINLGLPLLVCRNISKEIESGDALRVDLENGIVTIEKNGKKLPCDTLSSHVKEILDAGGIKPLFRLKTNKV